MGLRGNIESDSILVSLVEKSVNLYANIPHRTILAHIHTNSHVCAHAHTCTQVEDLMKQHDKHASDLSEVTKTFTEFNDSVVESAVSTSCEPHEGGGGKGGKGGRGGKGGKGVGGAKLKESKASKLKGEGGMLEEKQGVSIASPSLGIGLEAAGKGDVSRGEMKEVGDAQVHMYIYIHISLDSCAYKYAYTYAFKIALQILVLQCTSGCTKNRDFLT